jgi:hypothetical protein
MAIIGNLEAIKMSAQTEHAGDMHPLEAKVPYCTP